MNYYQEILIKPSFDISVYFLWEKLYSQIHLALVSNTKKNDETMIGVSFPSYDLRNKRNGLGNVLRVHANTREDIEKLALTSWLQRMSDIVELSAIMQISEDKITGYAVFSRKQVKSNIARLARRNAKRSGISFEEALDKFKNKEEQLTSLPFINYESLSSNARFKLFIGREILKKEVVGSFTSYGLSKGATVPLF